MRSMRSREREYFRGHVSAAKYRAKVSGVPFNITPEHLEAIYPQDGLCPILQIPMERMVGRGKGRDSSPSLDRTVTEAGYVIDNVSFISNKANRLKSSFTLAELERLLAHVKGRPDA